MRTLLLATASLLAVAAGCNSMSFARRGDAGTEAAVGQSVKPVVAQTSAVEEEDRVVFAGHEVAMGDEGHVAQVGHFGDCAAPTCTCAAPSCTTPTCAADPGCGCGGHGGCTSCGGGIKIMGGLLSGRCSGWHRGRFGGGCFGGVCGPGMHGAGGLAHGGWYGPYGGAHRTPGYPPAHHREYVGPQGPSAAQVGYPYYTIRGPRDFLLDNPPSIGR